MFGTGKPKLVSFSRLDQVYHLVLLNDFASSSRCKIHYF